MADHRTRNGNDIHAVAETFLREYLTETGSQHKSVRLSGAPRPRCIESHAVAKAFVKEHLRQRRESTNISREAERFEIAEPEQVILARRSGNVTSFFYGWKAERPLFTHAQHLAKTVDPVTSEQLVSALRASGVEVTVLPAPVTR